ncbi:hypothetical protein ACHAPE_008330 [Trichoderma viride]
MEPLYFRRDQPLRILPWRSHHRIDPSGHFSLFGMQFTWRALVITVVGTAVGIAFGVLTGGAGFTIEAGVAIAVGAASDVITSMFYDSVTGKGVTLSNKGTDLVYGLIGGIFDDGIGRAIGAAGRASIRGLSGAHEAVSEFVRNAEKLKIAGGRTKARPKLAPPPPRQAVPVPEIEALQNRVERRAFVDKGELPALREQLEALRDTHFNGPDEIKTYKWVDPLARAFPDIMTKEAMDKYNHFRDLVRREGEHPAVAAPKISDANFESYGGGQFQVKLSGELRLSLDSPIISLIQSRLGMYEI